jgi:hypothetical protein
MLGNAKKGSVWGGTKAAALGLCIFALVFGLALAGCSTDSDDGDDGKTFPAEMRGTWTKDSATMTIESSKMTVDGEKYVVYSVSDKTIEVSPEGYDNYVKFCTDWSVDKDALVLSGGEDNFNGTWNKQSGGEIPGGENPGSVPVALRGTWTTSGRSLTFTASGVTAVVPDNSTPTTTWSASVSGNTITLTGTSSYVSGVSGSVTYSITGPTLTIESHTTKVKLHEAFVGLGASTRDYTK